MISLAILSKSDAKAASYKINQKTAIISIINSEDIPVSFAYGENLYAVLPLVFDDVTENGKFCMKEKDGRLIKDFLALVLPEIERLIIHCECGVSISAGIAAAILKVLTGDDMSVFDNPRYVPNMHCYRVTMNSLLDENGEALLDQYDLQLENDH